MRNATTPTHSPKAPLIGRADLEAVQHDLMELEGHYSQYLEQESLKSDVQCLRSWIEATRDGDLEAAGFLQEHGTSLLENIKSKLQTAAREMQRIDEESPVGGHFSGGKSDRLNCAAQTAMHAEDHLAKALHDESAPIERPIVAK